MQDRTPVDRACEHCGEPVVARRKDARHCSKRCTTLDWYHRTKRLPAHVERHCPTCGVSIDETSHANRVFCSLRCRNAARRLSAYGLDQVSYEALLVSQGGGCAICSTSFTVGGTQQWRDDWDGWHIDHDHESGAVRGVLCPPCNLMIGYAKDRPDVLVAAAEYLRRPAD